jgi:hypothetical protein
VQRAPGVSCTLCFSGGRRLFAQLGRYPRREIARAYRLKRDEIRSICSGNGSALPLPLGEGWGEGLRSLVVHLPLTRFAEFIIGRRFAPTRWQIDLSPSGRGEGYPLTDRFNQTASRFSSLKIESEVRARVSRRKMRQAILRKESGPGSPPGAASASLPK